MTKTVRFVGIGLLLCYAFFINAQETCTDSISCDKCMCCISIDPTPAGQMISHVHEKGEWMVSTRFMFNNMIDINNGNRSIDKGTIIDSYGSSPDHMRMNMYMLMAMCGLTERLTIMTMFNYMTNYMIMDMCSRNSIHHHPMQSAGLGDTKLHLLYALVKKPTTHLIITGGIGFPTGSINNNGESSSMMYSGKRYPYMMQNGSGSYELLPGLCLTNKTNRLTYSAQFSGTFRLNKNSVGYKLGNEFVFNSWAAYSFTKKLSSSVRFEAAQTERIIDNDMTLSTENDISANAANTGGNRINGLIGLNFKLMNKTKLKMTLYGEYGLPIYQNVNGIQQITNQLANVALALKF